MKNFIFKYSKTGLAICLLLLVVTSLEAQKTQKQKPFKDTLDGAFDLSRFLIDAHGFIPVPVLITEPALGGIGGSLGTIFLQRPKPVAHTDQGPGRAAPSFPNTYYVGGLYTANNTWAILGGARINVDKWKMRFEGGGGYADMKMNFYHTFSNTGEQEFLINMKGVPVYVGAEKLFLRNFSVGLSYLFIHAKVSPGNKNEDLPDFISEKEIKSAIGEAQVKLRFDNRDNSFSPSKGFRVDLQGGFSEPFFGSDYEYYRAYLGGYFYIPVIAHRWTAGLRTEWHQVFDSPPFYMKPYVDLRGVPTMRYQGSIMALLETEQTVRVYKRWSAVGFGGIGKGFDSYSSFGDAQWAYSYGGGFRYLIARVFGLQMGADVGFSQDSWAFYIVFGSSWLR